VRRHLLLASGLCAVLLALYSCSMQAALRTDGEGHVVEVASIRLESSLARVAVALVLGAQLAVELRWTRGVATGSADALGG
jgi:hypothetical protein